MRWKALLLPVSLLAGLIVLLMPLPSSLIDLLLATNIAISVLVLLATIQVRSPTEFYAFPTVLLATTLFRLVLNIATTRLILTRAPEYGWDAAGVVVRQFGQFVASDQPAVGIVIFAIIVVVQYVVITNGTSRVSEVAARFTLDSLPGRQMSIDAELNAAAITGGEARRLRQDLQLQADFYGSMDGASKFVRGDAVAGLVITAINIVGGLILGISQGMSLGHAVDVYTKLTIGDGLVSQVPALLISMATALLVTRTSQSSDLGSDVVQQVAGNRNVLLLGSLFIVTLAFLKLPLLPLVILAGGCLWLAFQAPATAPIAQVTEDRTTGSGPAAKNALSAHSPTQHLTWDPLEIELGTGLVALADPRQGGDLLQQISAVRDQIANDLGMLVPKVRVRDNSQLAQRGYVIQLGGVPVAESTVFTDRLLAVSTHSKRSTLAGRRVEEPIYGGAGVWIDPSHVEQARAQGNEILSPSAAVARHLRQVVRKHSHELVNRDVTRALIESLRPHAPAVVDEILSGGVSLGQVQIVLRSLVEEDVSIRQLGAILETIIDQVPRELPTVQWTESVRRRLARAICLRYRAQDGILYHVALDVDLDAYLQEHLKWDEHENMLEISDDNHARLKNLLEAQLEKLRVAGHPPVVVVSPAVRRAIHHWSVRHLPDLVVLSAAELVNDIPHQTVGVVSTTDLRPRHAHAAHAARSPELAQF
ncbi:MAG: flagellar biosynthesis protein FlhA [Planctomycetota bacterium]|nr:flagellar biosynthesis protein FlhA [Planctomycetota bacterium]